MDSISRNLPLHGRSPAQMEKARGFGMTPCWGLRSRFYGLVIFSGFTN